MVPVTHALGRCTAVQPGEPASAKRASQQPGVPTSSWEEDAALHASCPAKRASINVWGGLISCIPRRLRDARFRHELHGLRVAARLLHPRAQSQRSPRRSCHGKRRRGGQAARLLLLP